MFCKYLYEFGINEENVMICKCLLLFSLIVSIWGSVILFNCLNNSQCKVSDSQLNDRRTVTASKMLQTVMQIETKTRSIYSTVLSDEQTDSAEVSEA